MIVSIIETEYQKVISSQKEEPDKISQPISIDSYIVGKILNKFCLLRQIAKCFTYFHGVRPDSNFYLLVYALQFTYCNDLQLFK